MNKRREFQMPAGRSILRTERGDTTANGQATESGFLVFAGAEGRAATVDSFPDHLAQLRNELLSQGILTLVGERIRLIQDHEFNSPSTAAAVLMGRSANGRLEWKRAGAMSLGEWEDLMASNEVTFRRRWYEAHRARFLVTPGAIADAERVAAEFADSAAEPLAAARGLGSHQRHGGIPRRITGVGGIANDVGI